MSFMEAYRLTEDLMVQLYEHIPDQIADDDYDAYGVFASPTIPLRLFITYEVRDAQNSFEP